MSTLTNFQELEPYQQDQLRETFTQYHVQLDPFTMKHYIRYMGENVDLESVRRAQVLLG